MIPQPNFPDFIEIEGFPQTGRVQCGKYNNMYQYLTVTLILNFSSLISQHMTFSPLSHGLLLLSLLCWLLLLLFISKHWGPLWLRPLNIFPHYISHFPPRLVFGTQTQTAYLAGPHLGS